MKKRVGVLGVLLVVLLGIAAFCPIGLPNHTLTGIPAQGENGMCYVAEWNWLYSRIYGYQGDKIYSLYTEWGIDPQGERRIVQVAQQGEQCYFVRSRSDRKSWELAVWNGSEVAVLCRETMESEGTVTGLYGQGEQMWITVLGDSGAIFIYQYTPEEGVSLSLALPAFWIWKPVCARYDGTQVAVTTQDGESYFITETGTRTQSQQAVFAPLPDLHASGVAWLLCKREVLLTTLLGWLALVALVLTANRTVERARHLVTVLTAVLTEVLLLVWLVVTGVLFVLLGSRAGLATAIQAVQTSFWVGGTVWILCTLGFWQMNRQLTGRIQRLCHQMEQLAQGDTKARPVEPGNHELAQMEQKLQELCVSLSIQNYAVQQTIQSYGRFVPTHITQLLQRANVEEIQFGDSRRIQGYVGLVAIGNRDLVRGSVGDAAFVEFINHTFGLFEQAMTQNGGWLFSTSFRLSAMEAYFPQTPEDGVSAGLAFWGLAQQHTRIPAPQGCMLLHTASVLYGIAGQTHALFPYVSSAELEFLGGFLPKLYQAQVPMVVTGAYEQQLTSDTILRRYIGYVKGEGQQYDLYEVLNAYPQLEQELRMSCQETFSNGLRCFYHGAFELARTLFAEVVKTCPQDGIARWYLFASERYVHCESSETQGYSLFAGD